MEERTFVALKPDAVRRGLVGRIVKRFEDRGYKIIGMKMLQPTMEMAKKHYEEHVGKSFYERLLRYITSGPIIAMVLQGQDVVHGVRQLMGSTKPGDAQPGTLRAEYAQIQEFNIVHGSDCVESAQREIDIYFHPEELCTDWKTITEIVMESEKAKI